MIHSIALIVDDDNCELAVFSDVSAATISDMTHKIKASPASTDQTVTALSLTTLWGESCPHSIALSLTSHSAVTFDSSLMKLSISTQDACIYGTHQAELIH